MSDYLLIFIATCMTVFCTYIYAVLKNFNLTHQIKEK